MSKVSWLVPCTPSRMAGTADNRPSITHEPGLPRASAAWEITGLGGGGGAGGAVGVMTGGGATGTAWITGADDRRLHDRRRGHDGRRLNLLRLLRRRSGASGGGGGSSCTSNVFRSSATFLTTLKGKSGDERIAERRVQQHDERQRHDFPRAYLLICVGH